MEKNAFVEGWFKCKDGGLIYAYKAANITKKNFLAMFKAALKKKYGPVEAEFDETYVYEKFAKVIKTANGSAFTLYPGLVPGAVKVFCINVA